MTTKKQSWFDVDKDGLRRIVERRGGVARTLLELVQNAWDTKATHVAIEVAALRGGGITFVVRDDDPNGFADLAHAWTLFAPSTKSADPMKRGRFNLGEKLALSLADEAIIVTKGRAVAFTKRGRKEVDESTTMGSSVALTLLSGIGSVKEIEEECAKLIAPGDVDTTLNGKPLPRRSPLKTFEASLLTEQADESGVLKRCHRKCSVEVFVPVAGEEPTIYEMGIPVVEFSGGEPFHVNVCQRVPLNVERDNVLPHFLRYLRTAVFNAVHDAVRPEQMSEPWVAVATAHPDAAPAAVQAMVKGRFGENAVAYDPNDREANTKAASEGRTVVWGGSLTKDQWRNVKAAELVPSAGVACPTPKPEFAKDGKDVLIDETDYTAWMWRVHAFSKFFARAVMGFDATIRFAKSDQLFAAWYERESSTLTWNRPDDWYAAQTAGTLPGHELLEILVHEFAHARESNHLSEEFHRAQGWVAAELATVCATGGLLWGPKCWGRERDVAEMSDLIGRAGRPS